MKYNYGSRIACEESSYFYLRKIQTLVYQYAEMRIASRKRAITEILLSGSHADSGNRKEA